MPSPITTHVLDTSRGRPAVDMSISLTSMVGGAWKTIVESRTDADGRITNLLPSGLAQVGTWRLVFHVGRWYAQQGIESFYVDVPVVFEVRDPTAHYHVPLLISPFGYSTYRGS